jgi:predicted transcriptional regulator
MSIRLAKRGRPRRSAAEDLYLAKLKGELQRKLAGINIGVAAKEIGVSRASLYKYKNGDDFPGPKALHRLKKWGVEIEFSDLELKVPAKIKAERRIVATDDQKKQLVFEFLEPLSSNDVQVLKVKPNKAAFVDIHIRLKVAGG